MAFSATLDECGALPPAATRTRVAGIRPRCGYPVKTGIEHARRDAGLSGNIIEGPFLRRFTAEARSNYSQFTRSPVGVYLYEMIVPLRPFRGAEE
jgi:hypothetical protein